jgi:hypothetical protein
MTGSSIIAFGERAMAVGATTSCKITIAATSATMLIFLPLSILSFMSLVWSLLFELFCSHQS